MFEIRFIYNGPDWVANTAAARLGLNQTEAEQFVQRQSLKHDVNVQQLAPQGEDTLLDTRNKLRYLDCIAGTAIHATSIAKIDKVYEKVAAEVTETQDIPIEAALKWLLLASKYRKLEPLMAGEFVKEIPYVSGFNNSTDSSLSDSGVKNFLVGTFGKPLLIKGMVAGIEKSDDYAATIHPYDGTPEYQGLLKAIEQGLITEHQSHFIFPDQDTYTAVEALFENCEPAKITHRFRNRALAGAGEFMEAIRIYNHSIEDLSHFPYLEGLAVSSEQLRAVYILGTIAHEVAHAIYGFGDTAIYQRIVNNETPQDRLGVTDYAREYLGTARNAQRPDDLFYNEDFSETMRLYVSNPAYLQLHFPRRTAYIAEHYPSIVPGTGALVASAVTD